MKKLIQPGKNNSDEDKCSIHFADGETEVKTKKVDKFHESDEINEDKYYFKVNTKELKNWFLIEIELRKTGNGLRNKESGVLLKT